MTRLSLFVFLSVGSLNAWAQQPPAVAEPKEEDETVAPQEYTFNPLQAVKEVRIGDYYFKKKSYRAAAHRYTEATRWNPNFADAYLRLGETAEKLKDQVMAKLAYTKYLTLSPDAKNAPEIRKKLQ